MKVRQAFCFIFHVLFNNVMLTVLSYIVECDDMVIIHDEMYRIGGEAVMLFINV
jgi:hypothetical protein